MNKKKLFIVTTVPMSLIFFKGQLQLLRDIFDVTLISTPDEELYKIASFNNVNSHGVSMKREISLFNDIVSLLKLIIFLKKNRPDIIHANTPKGSLLSLTASWILRVPQRIYYVHGLRYQGVNGVKKLLLMVMEKITCFFATEIIAVSQGVKKVLIKDKITKKNITVIWNGSVNGIDLEYFNPVIPELNDIRKEYNIDEFDFVFGYVGRLTGDKGINELIKAFSKINMNNQQSKLLLVGDFENHLDPLSEETIESIKSNRNIIHAGVQKDVRTYFKAMNILVFPSYREGFGIVLMEAAAMNVPAIASNIIGCNEIIEDNVNGFLIPSKNEIALYDKMKYSIENDLEVKKMANISRQTVCVKFEQKKLWDKTIEFYKNF